MKFWYNLCEVLLKQIIFSVLKPMTIQPNNVYKIHAYICIRYITSIILLFVEIDSGKPSNLIESISVVLVKII